jgi:hypothetical protein
MTIVSFLRSVDSQYLKIILAKKKKRTLEDRFLCSDETIAFDWVFVWRCNLKKKILILWFFTADSFFTADFFLTADSFWLQISSWLQIFFDCRFLLDCRFFLDCRFLLDCRLFCVERLSTIVLCSLCRRETVVENEDIRLFKETLLNNEFEELFLLLEKSCLCEKTRDRYWILNSTYNCRY